MNAVEKVKAIIEPLASQDNITVLDVTFRNDGSFEIPIMFHDGSMDLDTCAKMGELFASALEHVEGLEFDYTLDVCSPGAERELIGIDQMKAAMGTYVYVKLKNPKAGFFEIYGDLLEVNDTNIRISYMEKTRQKTYDIATDNISMIRLAIKI